MIYLELKGRLGNQFFRYAYARALQIKRGCKDEIVFGISNMKGRDPDDGWRNALADFNVVPYTLSPKRLVYEFGTFQQKVLDSLFFIDLRFFARNNRMKRIEHARKWLDYLNSNGLVHMVEEYHEYKLPQSDNIIIDGGFQNSKYFKDIRPILIKEFTPKQPLLTENRELYQIITNSNSICISIRRGDYVTVAAFNKMYNICTKEYFEQAVELMKQKVDNPVFIVFSDDVQWAKENLALGTKTYYERGCDPLWEKVRLMSACKHFIISNSSFSWMVQYLGQAEDKIVISPNKWYNGAKYPNYLIENNFLKIEV